jgi:hypothetical protein
MNLFPALLGCEICFKQNFDGLMLAFLAGAPFACFIGLHHYVAKRRQLWGFPQFGISDLIALTLLLCFPLFFVSQAARSLPNRPIAQIMVILMLAISYLWYRCLWLLQLNQVVIATQRMVFFVMLLPFLMLLGTLTAYWLSRVWMAVGLGCFELFTTATIYYIVLAGPTYLGIRWSKNLIFADSSQANAS